MITIRKQLITAVAAAYVAIGSCAAYAQAPAADAPQHDHATMAARMKERMAKRQQELHDKLKLNASQESAWQTYIGKLQPGQPPAHPSREEMAKLSAPERMDRMLAMMKEHEKRMEARVAATKEFYAVLTPDQQKIFNDEFGRGMHERHEHGMHGRHGQGAASVSPFGK